MNRYIFLCCIFLGFSCFGSESVLLDSNYYSKNQSAYGGIGLIQIPSARFSDDGEFSFGISTESPYNRLYAKVQFFPWLEAVVRYSEGTFVGYHGTGIPSGQTWKDKGIDVKFRIFEEGDVLPELAVGFADLGGTGTFASEYIVASKRVNNLDFTLGMGWGKLGGRDHISNPFRWLSDTYEIRGGRPILGGTFNLGRLFTGEHASFFGGVFTSLIATVSPALVPNLNPTSFMESRKILTSALLYLSITSEIKVIITSFLLHILLL